MSDPLKQWDDLIAERGPGLRAARQQLKAETLIPRDFPAETWAAARDLNERAAHIRDRFARGEIDEATSDAEHLALIEGVPEEVRFAQLQLLQAERANLQRGDEAAEA